jgi:hypothetical protein
LNCEAAAFATSTKRVLAIAGAQRHPVARIHAAKQLHFWLHRR